MVRLSCDGYIVFQGKFVYEMRIITVGRLDKLGPLTGFGHSAGYVQDGKRQVL